MLGSAVTVSNRQVISRVRPSSSLEGARFPSARPYAIMPCNMRFFAGAHHVPRRDVSLAPLMRSSGRPSGVRAHGWFSSKATQ